MGNGEIAAQLTISPNTVQHHVRNILAKLEVTNRTEAVYVAMQRGLVECWFTIQLDRRMILRLAQHTTAQMVQVTTLRMRDASGALLL